jgi:hypothetical protein
MNYYGIGCRGLVFTGVLVFSTTARFFADSYSWVNLLMVIVSIVFFVLAFVHFIGRPIRVDEVGFRCARFLKGEVIYRWSDVKEVFSVRAMLWTQVVTVSEDSWVISSMARNNYYETLETLRQYIPASKMDALTLQRAGSGKRKYFL